MDNNKWISGAAVALALSLGGWVYAQSEKVVRLEEKTTFQEKIIEKHDKRIEITSEKLGDMSGNIKETKVHMEHIQKDISEIKQLLLKL